MTDPDPLSLRPVEQTREAFGLLRVLEDDRVEQMVRGVGQRVREIAPGCVALSLSLMESELTFTLVADSWSAVLMDAVQYLDGGPYVQMVDKTRPVATIVGTSAEVTNEELWRMFGQAAAHVGIASTLSLPVLDDGTVVAGFNLYGDEPGTFDGHHDSLAQVCGAWPGAAVTNADLSFQSRVRAAAAPGRLAERQDVDVAVGIVSVAHAITPRVALARMAGAAGRAGVSEVEFARFLLDAHAAEHALSDG